MTAAPLIVTLKPDNSTFEFFNGLRQKYFPPERNFLSAHITLFHHLPGEMIDEISEYLVKIASEQNEFPLIFPRVRFLGKGTAIEIESTELILLRRKLAGEWNEFLTNQDKQKFQPHITIQNKVAPDEAKILFEETKNNWETKQGIAVGLQVWHYCNGPWELANEFKFSKS